MAEVINNDPPIQPNPQVSESAEASRAISDIMDSVPEPEAGEPFVPQVKESDKPPEAKVTVDPEPPEPKEGDEEFDAQLDDIKPAHQGQDTPLKAVKGIAKKLKENLKSAKEENQKLQEQIKSTPAITPELETELKELRQWRKANMADKDPEIQQKFTSVLNKNTEEANAIFKSNGLRANIIESISKAGGIAAVANSDAQVPDSIGGDKTWSEWVEDILLPKTPFVDRERLKGLIMNSVNLNQEMQKEVEYARNNFEEVQQNKIKSMGAAFDKSAEATIKQLGPIAQKWDYPKDATPEQKAKVDTHNNRLAEVVNQFGEIQKDIGKPEVLGRMVVMAAQSAYLMGVNKELMDNSDKLVTQVADLEAKLLKIKGAGSAAKKSNAPLPGTTSAPPKMESTKNALDRMLADA